MSTPESVRAGLRRLRLTTAALGIAAVVGTGALTYAVAAEATPTSIVGSESEADSTGDTTATDTTATDSRTAVTDEQTSTDTGSTLVEDDDSDAPVHASSGGS